MSENITRASLKADAQNRALRTFIQGLGIDLLVALALVLTTVFSSTNSFNEIEWSVVGFLLAKTVATTAASYIMRKFADGSVPTPLPPAPVPVPNEDVN